MCEVLISFIWVKYIESCVTISVVFYKEEIRHKHTESMDIVSCCSRTSIDKGTSAKWFQAGTTIADIKLLQNPSALKKNAVTSSSKIFMADRGKLNDSG